MCLYALTHVFACQGDEPIRKAQYFTNGHKLYTSKCQNCHGASGEGLGNLYPPLTDTAFLRNNRDQLACIVRYGMTGEIQVDGKTFDTEMIGLPELTNQEIAYILTYITNSFGNKGERFTLEDIEKQLSNCD